VRLDQCHRLLSWPKPLAGFVFNGLMAPGNIKLNLLIRVRETIDASTPITAPARRQEMWQMELFLKDMHLAYRAARAGARVIL